jgi:cytochrome c oxidase subunit I+III
VLVSVVNALVALRRGTRAGADPWQTDGLEWQTESPPPRWNFLFLPTQLPDNPVIAGLRPDRPEVLVTSVMDAVPDHRSELPGPSSAPVLVALATGVTFIAGIFTPWAFPIGGALAMLALLSWFWPRAPHREELMEAQP